MSRKLLRSSVFSCGPFLALRKELEGVVNTFDPWARDRGTYYSLQWEPREGAEDDASFASTPQ